MRNQPYVDMHEDIQRRRGYTQKFFDRAQRGKPMTFPEERHRQRATKRMLANGMPEWARLIVLEEAQRHMISPLLVYGKGRRRDTPRHAALYAAMYRIKRTWPMTTIAQIARWFGRDRSTASHGIAKHAATYGLPSLNNDRKESNGEAQG